jgi:hypothetical protein
MLMSANNFHPRDINWFLGECLQDHHLLDEVFPRPLEWAILIIQSDAHAALALAVPTWCDSDLPDPDLLL